MTETQQKALAITKTLLGTDRITFSQLSHQELMTTLLHVVEQSEAYKQEVSDAVEVVVEVFKYEVEFPALERFIIPKPDPLVEVVHKLGWDKDTAADLRAALADVGFEIREKGQ